MVNPTKFGGVDESNRADILATTFFVEGKLPFRYLGIPVTNKKLIVNQCMGLVDRTVMRIRHWSAKLLSFACRIQLIRSVIFAMTSCWMKCLLFPKQVIHKIEGICRSFLWSRSDAVTKKSPVV